MTQISVRNTKKNDKQTPSENAEKMLPLENGDRLSQPEFHDRYLAMPHVKKAELIEGVVYMPSPVRHRSHGLPHTRITGELSHYWLSCSAFKLYVKEQ